MRSPRWLVALATSTLLLSPTASAGSAEPPPEAGPAARWVTLPTGDRVLLQADRVVYQPNGSRGAFVSQAGGHTVVIPVEAMPAVAAGRVSPSAFQVAAAATGTAVTEEEHVPVTIRGIDRQGRPAKALLQISRPDGKPFDGLEPGGTPMPEGTATVTIPPGVIDVSAFVVEPATDTAPVTHTLVAAPEVRVDGATTVTLDARQAVPVSTAVRDVSGLTTREQAVVYARAQVDGTPSSRNQAVLNGPPVRFFATPSAPVTVGAMEFSAGARHEVPPFRARSLGYDGAELPVADVARAPRFTGVRDLVATTDVATSRGKLAVIPHDPTTGRPDDLLLAAQQAGARAVLLFNPNAPGIHAADSTITGGNPALTIPTLRTTRVAANQLLALMRTRPVTVRITGVAATPVVYDLLVPSSQIPANPRHVVSVSDLARVDETFAAHTPGTKLAEVRFGRTPLLAETGTGQLLPQIAGPYRRTSFLSARPVSWDGYVIPNATGAPGETGFYAAVPRGYSRGQQLTMRWFVPVATSGLPDNDQFWTKVVRSGDFLNVCLSPMDNGPDHVEAIAEAGTHQLTLSRDGQPVGSFESPCTFIDTPDGPATYQLALDAQRETPWWKFSTRVRSTWQFRSRGGDGEVLPLVLADLNVPDASSTSQVRVDQPSTITLALRHQKGAPTASFSSPKLELSYDGQTWTRLPLSPAGTNRFTTTVTHPATRAGSPVHLRLDIADTTGGRLTQEITRPFGLTR